MSLKLLDGPAEGAYFVKRAPIFLRAVVDANGKKDVLDQLYDKPSRDETVSVYQLVPGTLGNIHLHFGGRSRHATGFYVLADYRHRADVDGEALRDNDDWAVWCREHYEDPI